MYLNQSLLGFTFSNSKSDINDRVQDYLHINIDFFLYLFPVQRYANTTKVNLEKANNENVCLSFTFAQKLSDCHFFKILPLVYQVKMKGNRLLSLYQRGNQQKSK